MMIESIHLHLSFVVSHSHGRSRSFNVGTHDGAGERAGTQMLTNATINYQKEPPTLVAAQTMRYRRLVVLYTGEHHTW